MPNDKLQHVQKQIGASAHAEATRIIEQARAEADADRERREAGLRDQQRRAIGAARADADASLERDVTTRRADHAMKILEAKNEVLDAIFAAARDRILGSEGFDYGFWLARQVRTACEQGTGVLQCNPRDRAIVEAVAREAGADATSVEPDDRIDGGVLLTTERFDIDLTLASLLVDLRTDMTVSLAERLFADLPALGEQP